MNETQNNVYQCVLNNPSIKAMWKRVGFISVDELLTIAEVYSIYGRHDTTVNWESIKDLLSSEWSRSKTAGHSTDYPILDTQGITDAIYELAKQVEQLAKLPTKD